MAARGKNGDGGAAAEKGDASAVATGLVTCSWCGTTADPMPLAWISSTERDGRLRLYCERCARENLRSIEGRLDSEWW